MNTTQKQETINDEPVPYVHNTNSNYPDKIESYPAVHLSKYELAPVIK